MARKRKKKSPSLPCGDARPGQTQIATWIDRALKNRENEAVLADIRKEVSETNKRFPLP